MSSQILNVAPEALDILVLSKILRANIATVSFNLNLQP
jgi:hypothetical protein